MNFYDILLKISDIKPDGAQLVHQLIANVSQSDNRLKLKKVV